MPPVVAADNGVMFSKLSPVARTSAKLTVVLWCTVLAFVGPATIFAGQVGNLHEGISLVSGTVTSLVMAVLLYVIFHAIQPLPSPIRMIAVVAGVTLSALLQTVADYGGQFILSSLFADVVMPPSDLRSVQLTILIYLAVYACNLAVFWIILAAQEVRDQELELTRSEARVAWSEMERLRLQLNPHFMCNSLNSISGLITEGRHRDADDMTIRLADFLRASIEERSAEVTVAEEYAILEAYLDVEAVRFGARLVAELTCDDEVGEALLPQFLLQPLVENAIQYAVAPARRPVTVRVTARREGDGLRIDVTDDGEGRAPQRPAGQGRGIGLSNIRARLATRYGDTASLETAPTDAGFRATVRLPLTLDAAASPPMEARAVA